MTPTIVDVVFVLTSVIFNAQGTEIIHTFSDSYQTLDQCKSTRSEVLDVMQNKQRQKKDDYVRYLSECTPAELKKVERE